MQVPGPKLFQKYGWQGNGVELTPYSLRQSSPKGCLSLCPGLMRFPRAAGPPESYSCFPKLACSCGKVWVDGRSFLKEHQGQGVAGHEEARVGKMTSGKGLAELERKRLQSFTADEVLRPQGEVSHC